MSEEGIKIGTDKESDAIGVAWAIRNRAEHRYNSELYPDEVNKKAWMYAATSKIHGMNTNLAHDPLEYWYQWGIFKSEYELILAYNRAREIAIEVRNAPETKDISRGAIRWSDGWCVGGLCDYSEPGQRKKFTNEESNPFFRY